MFHYTNQNTTQSSSRRLASNDRLMNETAATAAATATNNGVYFHPYNSGSAPARDTSSMSHARSASDFAYHSHHQYTMEEENYDDEEPMDILYEREMMSTAMGDHLHSHARGGHHHRHHSEPANLHAAVSTNLDLQLTNTADHLMGLLQREANDYSTPLPVLRPRPMPRPR